MDEKNRASKFLIAALSTGVVLLFGLSVFLWISAREPGNDSAEAGFTRDMIVHHAQAVEMSGIVREKTENDRIKTLATDIALTQQAQIGQMQGWLNLWGLPVAGQEPAMSWMGHPTEGRMPGMASQEKVNQLGTLPPGEADQLFLKLMIPHHEAAVPMSRAVLDQTSNPTVENFANAVISAQQAEIETMKEMLRDMGGTVPEGEGMQMENHGDH
jgi:uncharacterized protein (DUF305 family)